ncbi:MAG: glycosyltransferase family 2 protein [Chloroflexota bacterium]
MRCPTLAELPPAGKSGWPWTEDSPGLPPTMPDGRPWPRVSVTTPSYNQAHYLEETIRSVLLQGYPNLEYMIIDGGSTDGSVDLIRRYAPWLAYWVSEADRGQAEAINKGWSRTSGEIVAYLNSDDIYVPGAIAAAATALQNNLQVEMIYSDCHIIDSQSRVIDAMQGREFSLAGQLRHNLVPQPTMFFRQRILPTIGLLDPSLQYTLDYEFCLRVGQRYKLKRVPGVLARYRLHQGTKSSSQMDRFYSEWVSIFERAAQQEELRVYLPDNAARRRGLALFNLGVMYYANGEMTQARSRFVQAARLYPALAAQPELWLYLLKCSLGARFMRSLRYWRQQIFRKPSLKSPKGIRSEI